MNLFELPANEMLSIKNIITNTHTHKYTTTMFQMCISEYRFLSTISVPSLAWRCVARVYCIKNTCYTLTNSYFSLSCDKKNTHIQFGMKGMFDESWCMGVCKIESHIPVLMTIKEHLNNNKIFGVLYVQSSQKKSDK